MGNKDGDRDCFIKFDHRGQHNHIVLQTKGGASIRSIDVLNLSKHLENNSIMPILNNDNSKPMALVKIPNEYDLVSCPLYKSMFITSTYS